MLFIAATQHENAKIPLMHRGAAPAIPLMHRRPGLLSRFKILPVRRFFNLDALRLASPLAHAFPLGKGLMPSMRQGRKGQR